MDYWIGSFEPGGCYLMLLIERILDWSYVVKLKSI